jgi:hypothetical protein
MAGFCLCSLVRFSPRPVTFLRHFCGTAASWASSQPFRLSTRGLGFRLSHGAALLGALRADAALHSVEFRDVLERPVPDQRRNPSIDVEEQSTPMRLIWSSR